jgi:hypothetical protein
MDDLNGTHSDPSIPMRVDAIERENVDTVLRVAHVEQRVDVLERRDEKALAELVSKGQRDRSLTYMVGTAAVTIVTVVALTLHVSTAGIIALIGAVAMAVFGAHAKMAQPKKESGNEQDS